MNFSILQVSGTAKDSASARPFTPRDKTVLKQWEFNSYTCERPQHRHDLFRTEM